MRYGRLQLLAAGSLFLILDACAPNAAAISLAEVTSNPFQTDLGKFESDRHISPQLARNSDIAYGSAWTVNGHFGLWFNEWSGVSLDGSMFRAGDDNFDRTAVSVTPLLVLRMQLLKSGSAPDGQIQPYIGVGPGIFFANREIAFHRDIGGQPDTAHMSVGIDFRAGMRWRISDGLDVFGEYRMTHYESNRGDHDRTAFYSGENEGVASTTNNLVGGLKVTF